MDLREEKREWADFCPTIGQKSAQLEKTWPWVLGTPHAGPSLNGRVLAAYGEGSRGGQGPTSWKALELAEERFRLQICRIIGIYM
jgi:hypothetical protein